jgi:hypothetical protein
MDLLKNNNNPALKNMVDNAEKGNMQEVENIARNICKENNVDFDQLVGQFLGKK